MVLKKNNICVKIIVNYCGQSLSNYKFMQKGLMRMSDNSTLTFVRNKYYDFFDLLKFICALFVVSIHVDPFSSLPSPLDVRLHTIFVDKIAIYAVPIFFVISSFFFFKKVLSLNNIKEKNKALLKYIKRNMQFYLFWLIATLPITLYLRIPEWFKNGNILLG